MSVVNRFKWLQVAFLLLLSLGLGCAKSKNLNDDAVANEIENGFVAGSRVDKQLLMGRPAHRLSLQAEGEKEYLLVRSIQAANANFHLVPGYQFNYGAVKFRILQDRLEVLPSNDMQYSRFGYYHIPMDYVQSREPIVVFPILKHFDIGRKKNDYGENTNVEAELEEGPWYGRKYMRVDWTAPKTKAFELGAWFSASLREADAYLSGPLQLHADGSIEMNLVSGIESSHFSERFFVDSKLSFVSLGDTDFRPRLYQDEDFRRFGLFRSFVYRVGMQRELLERDLQKYALIYNLCPADQGAACATRQIRWHLSHDMPVEYRELSRKAVDAWNRVFQQALGRKDAVVVLDEQSVDIASVRHNVIAYVDQPTRAGLLGVAQFTTHPLTGETLYSRSTVFASGIEMMRGVMDRVLDSLLVNPYALSDFLFSGEIETKTSLGEISEHARLSLQKATPLTRNYPSASALKALRESKHWRAELANIADTQHYDQAVASLLGRAELEGQRQKLLHYDRQALADGDLSHAYAFATSVAPSDSHSQNLWPARDLLLAAQQKRGSKELEEQGHPLHSLAGRGNLYEARLLQLAEAGIHGAELVEESLQHYIRKRLFALLKGHHGRAIGAEEFRRQLIARLQSGDPSALLDGLRADLAAGGLIREQMKQEIAERVFYSTLLHEMGHSFGLRHNFKGSIDEKNFHPHYHSLKEKLNQGDQSLSPLDLQEWSFSSVMDYNSSFESDLTELGPYDYAAIQYAYNPTKPPRQDFAFCSDEDVMDDLLCNRFDRGLNLSEITWNYIRSYKNAYFRSFFRQGRVEFQGGLLGLVYRFMLPIRTVMDEAIYQLIKAEPVPPSLQALSCSTKADAISVARGEFLVNICDNAAFESYLLARGAGRSPIDLDAPEYALNTRIGLSQFHPLGRADMVFATALAKQFFREILGSPEPGAYLLAQNDSQTDPRLKAIPGVPPASAAGGDINNWLKQVRESLVEMAKAENRDPRAFVEQSLPKVVNVDLGTAKYFDSQMRSRAGRLEVNAVGSLMEKYYAILTLSTRYLPVPKYYKEKLTGNVYLYPHTKDYAVDLFAKMIRKDDDILRLRYTNLGGEKGQAYVPAAQDINTQSLASLFSVMSFVNNQDKSFARKLDVISDRSDCAARLNEAPQSGLRVDLHNQVYCAFEDLRGESIVLPMLSELAAANEELNFWRNLRDSREEQRRKLQLEWQQLQAQDTVQINNLSQFTANFPDLQQSLPLITGQNFLQRLADLQAMPLFSLLKSNQDFQQQSFGGVFAQLLATVEQSVEGGVPSFLARVRERSQSAGEQAEPATEGQVEKYLQAELKRQGLKSSLFLSPQQELQNSSKHTKSVSSGPYVSDEELSQLADFYLEVLSYKNTVDMWIQRLVQINGADILMQRALSRVDSLKAPIDDLQRNLDVFIR